MVLSCCVKGCKSVWNPLSPVTFHCFPLKKEELLREWIRNIPSFPKVSKYSRICSKHFTKSSFTLVSGKTYLKKDSVPTIFEYDVLQDINAGKRKASPIEQDAQPGFQQLKEHSYPKASIQCETAAIHVPELSIHHEEFQVIQQSNEHNYPKARIQCKTAATHVPKLSVRQEEFQVIQQSNEHNYPKASTKCETAAAHIPKLFVRQKKVIQQSKENCYPEEASIECETVATYVPGLSVHHEEVIQQSKENSYAEEVSIERGTVAMYIPELSVHHEEVIQQSKEDSSSEEARIECETAATYVPESPVHHEEIVRQSKWNGHPKKASFKCETAKTYVPEWSLYHEEAARIKDVAVQTSPRRFGPSDEEIKLRHKIRLLQKQLGRREKTISNVQQLLLHLRSEGKHSDQLEALLQGLPGFKKLFKNEKRNSAPSSTA